MNTWMMRSVSYLSVIAYAAILVVGRPADASAPKITTDELLSGAVLGVTDGSEERLIADSEVLEVSPEMRRFIDEHVNPGAIGVFKLQQLIDAIMNPTSFGLQYDQTTRTASATFRERRGNCLSFSSMFVALAREAGLSAVFEEVDIPPDWTMNSELFVLNQHVNVRVDVGSGGVQVVDFNIGDFKTTYDIRTISDSRALAHFFNNLGVERMQEGDVATAVRLLRRAIEVDNGRFSQAWNNLGTVYRTSGHYDHAEAAYLRALQSDKEDTVAMSNLVGVYELVGDHEKAAVYRERVREHRLENPFYRFRLAQDAFFSRDFDTAIKHLKVAIRKRKTDDQFVFLLGLSYLMKGEEETARKWLARSEELAESDAQRRRYSTKIEALLPRTEAMD